MDDLGYWAVIVLAPFNLLLIGWLAVVPGRVAFGVIAGWVRGL